MPIYESIKDPNSNQLVFSLGSLSIRCIRKSVCSLGSLHVPIGVMGGLISGFCYWMGSLILLFPGLVYPTANKPLLCSSC